jgi:carbon-monoxide dehydrogenase medium subunit
MRDFDLLRPGTAAEASRMLQDHGEESRMLAGGTALLLALRQRLLTPSHIVYLGGVRGLHSIEFDERSGLRVGALATVAEIAAHPAVKARYSMMANMAAQVANPQVRNMATLGGNLCYGDPATDPPSCLMAMGARVLTVGPEGDREIELEDFFVDYYETALRPAEIVIEIRIPVPPAGAAGLYTRFVKNRAAHRPLVGVAIMARIVRGECREARITVGASTPIPTRAHHAEEFLNGKAVTSDVLREMAEMAARDVPVVSDFRGDEEYRRAMIRVVLARTASTLFSVPL